MVNTHKLPDYLEHGIIYQINPRAFCSEGTLAEASKLLPYIKEFGADIVYLCPIFEADSSDDVSSWSDRQRASGLNNPKNPYRISDYYKIDSEYGDDADLIDFVRAAHSLELRVILDLVYFHCGPNAVFLSEHPEFVIRDDSGEIEVGLWRFPKLNYDSQELREYLWQNMEYFIKKFDVDGYRCDVGDAVPLDFWAEGVRRIRAIKPDVMMLNEGTKPDYIDVFDLNYCWELRAAFIDCVEHGKPASTFIERMTRFNRDRLCGSFRSMVCLENHDSASDDYENRLEKRIGGKAMNVGFVISMLLPFVPFIYNGTEVADTNRHSLWANRFYSANLVIDWQNALVAEGKSRLELVKKLRLLRERAEFGLSGELEYIDADSDSLLVFKRVKDGASSLVAVNLSAEPISATLDIRSSAPDILLSRDAELLASGEIEKPRIKLGAYGYIVFSL